MSKYPDNIYEAVIRGYSKRLSITHYDARNEKYDTKQYFIKFRKNEYIEWNGYKKVAIFDVFDKKPENNDYDIVIDMLSDNLSTRITDNMQLYEDTFSQYVKDKNYYVVYTEAKHKEFTIYDFCRCYTDVREFCYCFNKNYKITLEGK